MPETTNPADCTDTESGTSCNNLFRCCNGGCNCCGCGRFDGDCGSCNGCGSCIGGCGYCDTILASCGCGGWLVVLAGFTLSFLVDGVASCFGVLLPALSAQIGASIADTAWAGSALCGGQLIAGPLVSALVNRLGCRPVVIAGSLISSMAFCLSAFASEVGLFIFMYGIVGGLGLGMMYIPSVIAVSIYFETRRALATGIVVCGSGVGTFCLAPLTQHMLDVSGWKGAQLSTAALLLTGVILGSVMSEPSSSPDECCSCCLGRNHSSADNPLQVPAGSEHHQPTDEQGPQSLSVSTVAKEQPSVGAERDRKATHAPLSSPDDAFLTANTGSYVKMSSPAVPSGDLVVVESPSPEGQVTPPKIFLFPEVRVQSASSASGVLAEDEGASGSHQMPELTVTSHEIDPGGLFPDDALRRQDFAASRSHLLSPHRRLSRLSHVVSGHLRPVSDLLYPRPAVSTPLPRSPHTPAADPAPVTARLRPLQRPDVFFSGRVEPAAARRRCLPPGGVPTSPSSPPSAPAAPGGPDSDVQRRLALGSVDSVETTVIGAPTPPANVVGGDSFSVLKEMLDVSLLRQVPFLLTCIGYALSMLGYFVPIVYILDEAVQHGVSPPRASMLVAVMGASNTVGRLAVGVLSGMQYMDVLLLNNVFLLGSGLVSLLFPFCETYSAYAAIASVFGLLTAANSTLSSLVLLEMVGLERLTNAFGLTLLFRGVAAVLGTPLAGFVAEWTGSYDGPFYMTGALLIIASLLEFLASVWGKTRCRARPDDESNSYRRADSVDG